MNKNEGFAVNCQLMDHLIQNPEQTGPWLSLLADFHHSWTSAGFSSLLGVVTDAAQRKKSLSDSWMAGSECRYWPDRKASLCAYLHGAGTRMVPGQFQYKWHILKVSLVRGKVNNVKFVFNVMLQHFTNALQ